MSKATRSMAFFLLLACACRETKRNVVPLEGLPLGGDSFSGSGTEGADNSDAPIVSLSSPASRVRGGSDWVAEASVTARAKIIQAQLQYASDGDNVSVILEVDPSLTSIPWLFERSDVGAARMRYIVMDETGRIGAALTSTFAVDSTGPAPPSFSLAGGAITNDLKVTLSIASCGDIDSVIVKTNDDTLTGNEASFLWQTCSIARDGPPYGLLDAPDGEKIISVWSRDAVGNPSLSASTASVTLDTTAPLVELTGPRLQELVSGVGTLQWSSTDLHLLANSASVEVSTDGGASFSLVASAQPTTGSYSLMITGSFMWRVSVQDLAGNVGTMSSSGLDDPRAPVLSLDPLLALYRGGSDLDLGWTITSETAITNVQVALALDGTSFAAAIPLGVAERALTIPLPTSDHSSARLRVTVTNAAGFTRSALSTPFSIDATPPAVAITAPSGALAGNAMHLITWTSSDAHPEPVASVAIDFAADNSFASPVLIANAIDDTGSYLWSVGALNQAAYLRVRIVDEAGNMGSASYGPLVLDSLPPTAISVVINPNGMSANGDASTGTVFASVSVDATDNLSPTLRVRLREVSRVGDCQAAFASSGFTLPQTLPALLPFRLGAFDGVKKVCAWIKDAAGNTTIIATPTADAGPDRDIINYFVDKPPSVTAFNVAHDVPTVGTTRITWSIDDPDVGDAAGLAQPSQTLSYSATGIASPTWILLGAACDPTPPATGMAPYSASCDWVRPTGPSGPTNYSIRIAATDKNGNTSIPVVSEPQPLSSSWSVFAGNDDIGIGGSASSWLAMFDGGTAQHLAVNPITGDVWVFGLDGLFKVDARTGIVARMAKNDAALPLLSDGGAIPPLFLVVNASPAFDSKGRLYLNLLYGGIFSSEIWQLDFENDIAHRYLGGGTSNAGGASPFVAHVNPGSFAFDDQDTLYYFSSCEPGVYRGDPPVVPLRVMRSAQMGDAALPVEHIAGACTGATPALPANAIDYTLVNSFFSLGAAIVPVNDGNKRGVYFHAFTDGFFKVIDGTIYSTSMDVNQFGGAVFDPVAQRIMTARENVNAYTINLAGTAGETLDPARSVSALGSGETIGPTYFDCTADGILAANACVAVGYGLAISGDGTVVFSDGPAAPYSPTALMVRYVDSSGRLRTLAGTKSLTKNGLPRHLVRGAFHGIHYHDGAAGPSGAWPAGLYFVNPFGPVFGRISLDPGPTPFAAPQDDLLTIEWGNQRSRGPLVDGSLASEGTSMGGPASGGNGSSLAFHATTREPWMRANDHVVSLAYASPTGHTMSVKAPLAPGARWDDWPDGTDSTNVTINVFGGLNNLAMKDDGVFLVGGYRYIKPNPSMVYVNYAPGGKLVRVFGNESASGSPADGPLVPTSSTLPLSCFEGAGCYLSYVAGTDRLYFSDGNKVRYLTNPALAPDPMAPSPTPTIGTLFDAGMPVYNFSFRPGTNQVFLISTSGLVSCDGDAAWACTALGPPAGFPALSSSPDQLTWYDSSRLFISTAKGHILSYEP